MKRNKNTSISQPVALAVSVLFSYAVLMLLSFVTSIAISKLQNPSGSIWIGSLISFVLSGFISGIITSRRKGDGGTLFTLISGVLFISILIILSLILNKGHIPSIIFLNLLCYISVLLLGAFLGRKREHKRKHHR